jgi:flagellar basal-body rod protein FlgB
MFEMLFENSSLPVLQQVMSFSEQRQRVLADNVAYIDTPGYRQQDLPVGEFTAALGKAISTRDEKTPHRFWPRSTRNVEFGSALHVSRVDVSGQTNFYDAGNRSVEQLMADMGENALWHNLATELYRQQSQLLESAIRERVT